MWQRRSGNRPSKPAVDIQPCMEHRDGTRRMEPISPDLSHLQKQGWPVRMQKLPRNIPHESHREAVRKDTRAKTEIPSGKHPAREPMRFQTRAPLHKTFCQTFFGHKKNSGKSLCKLHWQLFFCRSFLIFAVKNSGKKFYATGPRKRYSRPNCSLKTVPREKLGTCNWSTYLLPWSGESLWHNRVPREKMWRTIQETGINSRLLAIIKSTY